MLKELVGSKIQRIFFNENYLKFETDRGNFIYGVEGDCCSTSMFYDFIGVRKLLSQNIVTQVEAIDLYANDIVECDHEKQDRKSSDSEIQVYGYKITTLDPIWGEVTSVVSFRNYSNGYYGGWMECTPDRPVSPEIFDDVLESASGE